MKKLFIAMAVVVSSFGMVNAQATQTTRTTTTERLPEVRAKEMVAKINTAVTLTGNQFGTVNNLYIEFFKKQDALRAQKGTLDATSFEQKMDALKSERDAQLGKLLSAEQNKSLDKARTAEKAEKEARAKTTTK